MGAVKKYSGLLGLATFMVLLFVLLRRPVVVSGTELGYRLPPGAPAGVEDVVRSRVAALGAEGEVERQGDLLLIRVPDALAEDVKRLLRRRGKLEFRPAADRPVQEAFQREGVVPEGCQAIDYDRKGDAAYAAWSPKMLIEAANALEGGRIIGAHPMKETVPGGEAWFVQFELDAVGARKFDETAARLFERRPTGLIAILLDGKLTSAPAVQAKEFGGSARITGIGGEREAKDLAIVLTTGPLPVPLDAPEFERPFQKTR